MPETVPQPCFQDGKPKECKVKVIARCESEAPGVVSYRIESDLKNNKGELVFDKTADKMKKVDYYHVVFLLVDDTDLGLRYPDDPAAAIWVGSGAHEGEPECPTEQCHNEQVYGVDVSDHGKKLVVRNNNQKIENLAFALRFIRGRCPPEKQSDYLVFDPIIRNGNGGID